MDYIDWRLDIKISVVNTWRFRVNETSVSILAGFLCEDWLVDFKIDMKVQRTYNSQNNSEKEKRKLRIYIITVDPRTTWELGAPTLHVFENQGVTFDSPKT